MSFPGEQPPRAANEAKKPFPVPQGLSMYVDYLLMQKKGAGYLAGRKLTEKGQGLAGLVFDLEKVQSETEIVHALIKALGQGGITPEDFSIMIQFLPEKDQDQTIAAAVSDLLKKKEFKRAREVAKYISGTSFRKSVLSAIDLSEKQSKPESSA